MTDKKSLSVLFEPENQQKAIDYVRAIVPAAERMTDMAVLCCWAIVELKGDEAAVAAALSCDENIVLRHGRSQSAKRVIRELMRQIVSTKGRVTSLWALIDIASDTGASPAARRSAAVALQKINDAHDAEDKLRDGSTMPDHTDMTLEELERVVAGMQEQKKLEDATIDGDAVLVSS